MGYCSDCDRITHACEGESYEFAGLTMSCDVSLPHCKCGTTLELDSDWI